MDILSTKKNEKEISPSSTKIEKSYLIALFISGVQHTFTFDCDFTREHVLSDAKNIHYLSKNIYLFV